MHGRWCLVRRPGENQYRIVVPIVTGNGCAEREFGAPVPVGMAGINAAIPVPIACHSSGGWERSAFGDTTPHGMEGVRFWTLPTRG